MNSVQQLIGQGRLEKALEVLLKEVPTHFKNDVLQLQGRLNTLKRQEIMNIINGDEARVERSKITVAALELCNQATEAPSSSKDVQKPLKHNPAPNKPYKAFISYARKEDNRYLKLFAAGVKAHSNWEIVTDRQILIGEDWHERLQQEVQACDFAILLLSPYFFKSEYIKKDEFAHFVERNERDGFPFFSVLLADADYRQWGSIAQKQFFVAEGQDYDLAKNHRDSQISFDLLARFDRDGELIPNPYLGIFYKNFVAKVNEAMAARQG